MRVLILTGEYPRIGYMQAACFVNERFKIYRENGIELNVYAISEKPSIALKLLRYLRKIKTEDKFTRDLTYDTVQYKFIQFRQGIFHRFFHYEKYGQFMADAVKRRVKVKDYDIIVAHIATSAGWAAKILSEEFNKPYVVISHGSDIHTSPFLAASLKETVVEILAGSRASIFVSRALLDTAKNLGYSPHNAHVVPNGINPGIFNLKDKKDAKTKCGISDSSICIGFVGNLMHVKRADCLIEIFRAIKDAIPNAYFTIIGNGYLKNELLRKSGTLKIDVHFTGSLPQEDVASYMKAMDLMILPSRNEGWPCVVLEAQACGTPVAGSNCGGIPEAVGECGIIIEDGADFIHRFANESVNILKKPFDPEVVNKRAMEYTWEKTAGQEVEIFREILRTSSL
ncbi:MAG: hypothetical protein A2020_07460 [Lentisphaerae bacterium GWF2_45_14]|nr:MAG: hypothetical protein A2020_07460 [Lentisphaerae bacterium GWF2_45_14]